jgi:hypothetical protein
VKVTDLWGTEFKPKVKDAKEACQAIVDVTKSYAQDSGSPEDTFIHRLRLIALAGLEERINANL